MTSRVPDGSTGRALVPAFVAFLVASALHFADNALRFDRYHDAAMPWLTPAIVVVAWLAQTAFGATALVLHRRGHPLGRPMLAGFAVLGFAGLLHYAAGMPRADGWMHALIALEALAGAGLFAAAIQVPATPSSGR